MRERGGDGWGEEVWWMEGGGIIDGGGGGDGWVIIDGWEGG